MKVEGCWGQDWLNRAMQQGEDFLFLDFNWSSFFDFRVWYLGKTSQSPVCRSRVSAEFQRGSAGQVYTSGGLLDAFLPLQGLNGRFNVKTQGIAAMPADISSRESIFQNLCQFAYRIRSIESPAVIWSPYSTRAAVAIIHVARALSCLRWTHRGCQCGGDWKQVSNSLSSIK